LRDNCYWVGYWQSEEYFKNIEKQLQMDFSFERFSLDVKMQMLLQKIKSGVCPVAIHI